MFLFDMNHGQVYAKSSLTGGTVDQFRDFIEARTGKPVECRPGFSWNFIAYLIPKNDTSVFSEDWSFLYGELAPGQYRIGKEIMDFRRSGDLDQAIFYAYFTIK